MSGEIIEIGFDELRHGLLAEVFSRGAVAAVIHARVEVRAAWKLLLQNTREHLPWEAPLLDISRNHRGTGEISNSVGDAYYFKPGRHAHFARKIELTRSTESGPIQCSPSTFVQGDEEFVPEPSTLDLCWRIGSRIMESFTPSTSKLPEYRIAIQRLKYQESFSDLEQLYQLIASSLGGWAQLGYALDSRRDGAAGVLSPRGICDFYALLGIVQPLRILLSRLNRLLAKRDSRNRIDGTAIVIGKAHYDSRYFSGLCGSRSNIRTEVYTSGRWIPIPIDLDSIVVIPGTLAKARFGLSPVLHRVLQEDCANLGRVATRDSNVTLLFGAK